MTTMDNHIVIPSIAIKRLLDGINNNFKFSNLFLDYKLTEKHNGIVVCKSYYNNIKNDTNIIYIGKNIIINGKVKYTKINEWTPIEVYLWYEWLPSDDLNIHINNSKINKINIIKIPFVDFNTMNKIPYFTKNEKGNIKLSYELIDFLFNKNILLINDKLGEALNEPYKECNIKLDLKDEILISKYEDPTEIKDFSISLI